MWTNVVQQGDPPLDSRLAEIVGDGLGGVFEAVTATANVFNDDDRFRNLGILRHRFSTALSADEFVNVRNTYVRTPDADVDVKIRRLIARDFEGGVTKIEDTVTFLFERR